MARPEVVLIRFCTYLVIFSNFIPISLLVSMNLVKLFQASEAPEDAWGGSWWVSEADGGLRAGLWNLGGGACQVPESPRCPGADRHNEVSHLSPQLSSPQNSTLSDQLDAMDSADKLRSRMTEGHS